MKKIYMISALISPFLLTSGSAAATDDCKNEDKSSFYVKAEVGALKGLKLPSNGSYLGQKFDNNPMMFGAALGYQFNSNFRTEISFINTKKFEFNYSDTLNIRETAVKISSEQKLKSQSLMLNGYLSMEPIKGTNTSPYLTSGVGISKNKAGQYTTEFFLSGGEHETIKFEANSKNSFAWNVGAGINIKASDNFFVDLGYKYYNFGKFATKLGKDNENVATKLKAHAVTLALGITF